ncbi:sensor histidine kinase [Trinickia sp. EG282A]|uniref:sensor histidine kinase n=1 Tax=Trinickia sp. EG282A TaxID=3237013 RepID=UPI0034D2409E
MNDSAGRKQPSIHATLARPQRSNAFAHLATGKESTTESINGWSNALHKLRVDCPPLATTVSVDRGMWEKIVLNLISNAFKFTFEGEIVVALRQLENVAELQVRDTGTGIPADELPHLFERFHRRARRSDMADSREARR